jgi:hypothetical protein
MESCDVLMLCHDVDRGVVVDGQLYSQIIDPVRLQLIQLGFVVNVMSHPYSTVSKDKIYGHTYSFNRKYVLMKLQERCHWTRLPGMRTRTVSHQHLFWLKLLKKLRCKTVVLIGAPPALCQAASELGLSVIELFHGYGYHQIPWGYDRREIKELPTHFISFDLTSLKTFQNFFDSGPKTYFSCRPNVDQEVGLTQHSTFDTERAQVGYGRRVSVLLSMGWMEFISGAFLEISKDRIWPNIIDEIQEIAADEVQWYIRPHPMMLRDKKFRKHIEEIRLKISSMDNCCSIEESTISLPNLLEKIDVHLTFFSEIAFEAASAGVPTLFLSDQVGEQGELHGRFIELFKSGLAQVLVGDSNTALSWIRTAERVNSAHFSKSAPTVIEILQNEIIPSEADPLQ